MTIPRGWADASDMPGYLRHGFGVASVIDASTDPNDTMLVALTKSELALFVFGSMLVHDLFPECRPWTFTTIRKLGELSDAQKFLPDIPEDGDTEYEE